MINIKPEVKIEPIEIKKGLEIFAVKSIEPVAGPSRKRKGLLFLVQ